MSFRRRCRGKVKSRGQRDHSDALLLFSFRIVKHQKKKQKKTHKNPVKPSKKPKGRWKRTRNILEKKKQQDDETTRKKIIKKSDKKKRWSPLSGLSFLVSKRRGQANTNSSSFFFTFEEKSNLKGKMKNKMYISMEQKKKWKKRRSRPTLAEP